MQTSVCICKSGLKSALRNSEVTLLSIIYGLLSAIGWGAADFTGGLASKKSSPYQVLFLAEIAGILPLVIIVLLVREPLPALPAWLWSGLASTVGTLGLPARVSSRSFYSITATAASRRTT